MLNGKELCGGKARKPAVHYLFDCTLAMQARQNARDFFPIKNFGASFLCTLRYSGCYSRGETVSMLLIAEIN